MVDAVWWYKSFLGYQRVYLPLHKVTDALFHIQGGKMYFTVDIVLEVYQYNHDLTM